MPRTYYWSNADDDAEYWCDGVPAHDVVAMWPHPTRVGVWQWQERDSGASGTMSAEAHARAILNGFSPDTP